ncbi:MAG: hypothetical protein BWK78_02835 [Thiotrichaceae bacterium IS1]|nr:MAG: hypothetical protein BWK78_02835 [Thiotrichaceae bacterium IS1]
MTGKNMNDAYPLSDSAKHLFRFFNSINLFLPKDEHIHKLADKFVDWLEEYVKWYKATFQQAVKTERLASAFPILIVRGEDIIGYETCLERILRRGRECGFVLSLNVRIEDCQNHEDFFTRLCNDKLISYLHVNIRENFHTDLVMKLIELNHANQFYLTLNAPVELLKTDLFFSEELGGGNIQIIPNNNSPVDVDVKDNSSADIHVVTACIPHFLICIDEKGDIYPCMGLFGLKHVSLGSIYDRFSETAFGQRESPLDLEKLALFGPEIQDVQSQPIVERCNRLPRMCNLHRTLLTTNGIKQP